MAEKSKVIDVLKQAPAAFTRFALKLNEVIRRVNSSGNLSAKSPLTLVQTPGDSQLSLDIAALNSLLARARAAAGNSGGGDSGGDNNRQELHYDDGTITIDIDSSGIRVAVTASGDYVLINTDGEIRVVNTGAGKTLALVPSDILQDMAVRAIDVCDSGTPKYMDVIGSAPYT